MVFKDPRKTFALFEGFSLFALICVLLLVISVSISTEASLILVLIGFSPTIITIISCILIYEEASHRRVMMWFLPLVLTGLFFYVATSQDFLRSNLDIAALIGLNIAISLLYLTIFFLLIKMLFSDKKKEKKSIKTFVASIEDKSKALNYVIGRVYSQYHGGNKQLRELITIPSEWYNEFNETKSKEETLKIVIRIENRLKRLLHTEQEVFPEKTKGLKNLKRNKDGSSKIINVLMDNDNDPVQDYYEGAIMFCEKVREQLIS